MNHVKSHSKKIGADVGYHSSNIHPANREGCVGKAGINKTFTLDEVLELAYKIEPRPNIIIKSGPNAKWYMKRFQLDAIDEEIQKQKWRNTTRSVMYIIEWQD